MNRGAVVDSKPGVPVCFKCAINAGVRSTARLGKALCVGCGTLTDHFKVEPRGDVHPFEKERGHDLDR